jgi:DNA-binding CsgD family transcriptional regulator
LEAGLELLALAEAGPLGELERARADLVRAQIAYVAHRGNDAPPMLLKAAKRLEEIAPDLARATYLDALTSAVLVGRMAAPGGSLSDITHAPGTGITNESTATSLFLAGFRANLDEGYSSGLPILRSAMKAFRAEVSANEELRGFPVACVAAIHTWDEDSWDSFSVRWADLCRNAGALSDLPLALNSHALVLLFAGELAGAALLTDEVDAATEATGMDFGRYGAMALAAFRGSEAQATALIEASVARGLSRGEGNRVAAAEWTNAILNNGLGRYEAALAAAQRADVHGEFIYSVWALAEVIEAGVRSGANTAAADAHRRFAEMAHASASDWALGLEARLRALLTEDEHAEWFYASAIDQLGRTRMRIDLARAHLLSGEWLRRQRRRSDSRAQLHTALRMFEAMGMDGFAERARRELRATGEKARKRNIGHQSDLTAQEALIARLASEALSNPEIASRLFLSPRTVEYHLGKVFTKLGVTSRGQLTHVLAGLAH